MLLHLLLSHLYPVEDKLDDSWASLGVEFAAREKNICTTPTPQWSAATTCEAFLRINAEITGLHRLPHADGTILASGCHFSCGQWHDCCDHIFVYASQGKWREGMIVDGN
mmetsp:Transcript_115762/g.338580  ORF Transcript_115762/g.338580 Transcript_115762/m.338580 type:complete len:110 (-) Transcript_115762:358-687(-)